MDVRPVLTAAQPMLTAVEARDADVTTALGQLSAWDRDGLVVPRIVVGIAAAPDPGRVETDLATFGVAGPRLALALAEASLDDEGMRPALASIRDRTGAIAIVADFGSGAHPDLGFLVDYPADSLALSARITDGIAEREDVASRVREACTVAGRLGWAVIAADVAAPAEREALAAAGVTEVTGPAIAPFAQPAELGALLVQLGVTISAAPAASGRAQQASRAAPAVQPAAEHQAPAESHQSRFSHGAEEKPKPRITVPAEPRPAAMSVSATSISAAEPAARRGSPGRSQPARGAAERRDGRGRGSRILVILAVLLLLAAAAYAVLAYLGHVPDPLGIEDIEL